MLFNREKAMSLSEALRGNLHSWQGLSGAETLEHVSALLEPIRHTSPAAERMRTYQRFWVTVFERAMVPYLVEVWSVVGSIHVALIEYENPLMVELERTLQHYGPPDLILTDRRFSKDGLVREHVYARRGVTFSVLEPFATPTQAERRVVHLQLYPATSPEFYITDIGAGEALSPQTHPA
jgi:hypothetical protein